MKQILSRSGLILSILFIVIVGIMDFQLAKVNKDYTFNYDLLPYMSLVLQYDGEKDPEVLHKKVFDTAKKELPEKVFSSFLPEKQGVGKDQVYRWEMYNSPRKFYESSVPHARPLYNLSSYVIYKLGFGLIFSVQLISYLSVFLIHLLLFVWMKRLVIPIYMAVLVSLLFVFFPPLSQLALIQSPDALNTLFVLFSLYLFIEKRLFWTSIIFFCLSICIRYDNIILHFFLFVFCYFNKKELNLSNKKIIVGFLCVFFTYIAFSYGLTKVWYNTNYSYLQMMSRTFNLTKFPTELISNPTALSIYELFETLYYHIKLEILYGLNHLRFYFVFFFLYILMAFHNTRKLNMYHQLFFAVFIALMVRYFLHPAPHIRFYTVYFLLLSIIIIKTYFRDKTIIKQIA